MGDAGGAGACVWRGACLHVNDDVTAVQSPSTPSKPATGRFSLSLSLSFGILFFFVRKKKDQESPTERDLDRLCPGRRRGQLGRNASLDGGPAPLVLFPRWLGLERSRADVRTMRHDSPRFGTSTTSTVAVDISIASTQFLFFLSFFKPIFGVILPFSWGGFERLLPGFT